MQHVYLFQLFWFRQHSVLKQNMWNKETCCTVAARLLETSEYTFAWAELARHTSCLNWLKRNKDRYYCYKYLPTYLDHWYWTWYRYFFQKKEEGRKCTQNWIISFLKEHGLRTFRESFFFSEIQTLGLGQTNWAEHFWGTWGIFSRFIDTTLLF